MSTIAQAMGARRFTASRARVALPGFTALLAAAALLQGAFWRQQALLFAGGLGAVALLAGVRRSVPLVRVLAPLGVAAAITAVAGGRPGAALSVAAILACAAFAWLLAARISQTDGPDAVA